METNNLQELENLISYEFKDKALLLRALTHRSYLNESHEEAEHNERLEFLGDAVLELAITKHLFSNYPNSPEGDLTSFRAAVVRTESLAETAMELNLGKYIQMSKGEEATGGRTRPYILANTVEALLGAIYLDSGYDAAQNLINRFLAPKLDNIVANRLDIDPKSKLQELSQEKYKFTPFYEVMKEEGPDHERVFTVRAIVNDKEFGIGEGRSKQDAEQAAARDALSKFAKND
jgi:ribonuclease-3